MKILIWKELRENARWAALGGFGLFLAEIFTLSGGRAIASNESFGVTLGNATFLLASMFGCVVVGAALGALQILPEQRRDQWASLLHRPVPRHVIFLGKMAAGLLLYTLATGLPLLASTVYVAWPGRVPAPFMPSLLVPALSDLLFGAVFYFGAMLLGLHGGHWWGARAIIFASAVAALVLHAGGEQPFLLSLIAIAVFFAAAWGAMEGSVAQRPRLSRWALGILMLVGAETACLLAGASLQALARPNYGFSYSSDFYIAHDGTVLRREGNNRGGYDIVDLQGQPVTDERYVGGEANNSALYPNTLIDRQSATGVPQYVRTRSSRDRVELIMGNDENSELWYRICGPRGYFIGYDRRSARCLGICDAEGFKSAGAAPQPFASELQGEMSQFPPYAYWVGSRVLSIDFAERRMSWLADLGSETILSVAKYPAFAEHHQTAVALATGIRFFRADGALAFFAPYTHDAKGWPYVGIVSTEDFRRTFIHYSTNYMSPPGENRVPYLEVFDEQGHPLASYPGPREKTGPMPNNWGNYLASGLYPQLLTIALEWQKPVYRRTLTLGEGVLLFAFAVGYAGLAGVWARRVGLSRGRTVFWIGLAFVAGLGGLLAYRLATAWPACVRCPQCGRPRPVTESACPRCRQGWEAVPASGTEIFEGV